MGIMKNVIGDAGTVEKMTMKRLLAFYALLILAVGVWAADPYAGIATPDPLGDPGKNPAKPPPGFVLDPPTNKVKLIPVDYDPFAPTNAPGPRWEDTKPLPAEKKPWDNLPDAPTNVPVAPGKGMTLLDEPAEKTRVAYTPIQLFAKVSPSLVIISTPKGVGSGFIVFMDGKKYLITNEHLMRGGYPVSAKLLNGSELLKKCEITSAMLEVADDRDLVRIEIDNSIVCPALQLFIGDLGINTPINIYGNSDGAGVATSLSGKVIGIGPDQIEVDATFIPGNSGSPIIDSSGDVLGVATFLTLYNDPKDWAKKGTRFNDVRRFGVRITNSKWVSMTFRDYLVRAETLLDMDTYCCDLVDLFYTFKYRINDYQYVYDYNSNLWKYRKQKELCRFLSDAAKTYSEWCCISGWAAYYKNMSLKAKTRQETEDFNRRSYQIHALIPAAFEKYKKACKQIYLKPEPMLINTDWKTKKLLEEATRWYELLKRFNQVLESNF